MVGFRAKQISNPPSLSERLKEQRQKAGVSLKEASQATNISLKYLAAIEAGDFSKLPGDVYAKNFLKVYTKFLGLNSNQFLAAYQSEQKIYTKTKKGTTGDFKKPVKRVSQFHLLVTPKIVKGLIIGFLAIACFVYLGIKIKTIMTPPVLIVERPTNNLVTDQNVIEVKGQVEKEATLEINGQQVLADEKGNFSEMVDLQPGVNSIIIRAEKRHGKQTKIYRQVVVVNETGDRGNLIINN